MGALRGRECRRQGNGRPALKAREPAGMPCGPTGWALAACYFFGGQGTLTVTVAVPAFRKVSSALPGKPPFGQVFGIVP